MRGRTRGGMLLAGLLLAGLLLAGCADTPETGEDLLPEESATAAGEIRVTDDAGREWRFDVPPERVISLVPSSTGILRALGMEERLVARTDFDRDTPLAGLPSVGGGLHPSVEVLTALDPDLVVRFEGPTDRATPETLDRRDIPHLAIRPDTIGDIRRIIRMLARTMGVEERGEALVAEMDHGIDSVRALVADRPRPRVVFLLGGDPPWVAGADTFLDELVEIAGGENIFADTGPLYAPVSIEEIIQRDPELILATEGSRVPPALQSLPLRRVPETVQSPGVEVARSAATLARILHEPEGR